MHLKYVNTNEDKEFHKKIIVCLAAEFTFILKL